MTRLNLMFNTRVCPWQALLLALVLIPGGAYARVPKAQPVVLVVEENHSFESVIGQPAMPFLNELASRYGLAMRYYANAHPSLPNYFWLSAGQPVTFNDNTRETFDVDNLVRHLQVAGKTWKAYAESLPHAGYTGYNVYPYVKRHNPFAYFRDVASSHERNNIVPFSQFTTDVRADRLPDFVFIVPNQLHNGHDASLAAADQWLKGALTPLLNTPAFKPGGRGLLVITFDESFAKDCRPAHCGTSAHASGGRVATVLIGPRIRHSFRSFKTYRHENLLRTVCDAFGFGSCPGRGGSAKPLGDFFR